MRALGGVVFLALVAVVWAKECPANKSNAKLFCYFSKLTNIDGCRCSYVILPADADVKAVERAREAFNGVKILVTVNEFNQGLLDLLKTSKVDGLEIDLKKLDSKNDIKDFIATVRSKLDSDLYLALSVPARAETLAKYYDFKGLSKHADVFILQTAFLGASKNVTFHPSRLSGLWDTQNTDSMVDLVSGLGAPLSKVVISAPVQAFHFTLQNGDYSAPGSPALELKSITRTELCQEMRKGSNWTLERDQDQAGPYIFSGNNWIAFEDSSSIDVKAKYARVRGLAGLALKDVSQDGGGEECGSSVLEAAYEGLSRQARAPRGAVLHSLERELQGTARGPLEGVQLSPYRISRVIDVEGHVHVVRQDTRTEFSCSRQGFFAHPRSCNRFYRCVLFDQTTDEFSVFEFDCPAGLAFDERVEVCVWPGSLPEGRPCAGSSEIAPVPRSRFVCPHEPGYYADPENCRWFFACLDHGNSPLSAYEFRCPFGLVFDSDRLMCEWPWLVSRCASGSSLGINLGQDYVYGELGYASSNALDQYNGLGSLGLVRLGGLTGQIQQPVIYSNVGGGELGGLGIKATQALRNAGLLRGTGIYDNEGQYSSGAARSNLGYGSLNQQAVGSFGTTQDGAGAGSSSYNSNSGLDASSLNGGLRLEGSGTSQQGAGAESYSYNSNSGLDASSSSGDSRLGGSGAFQNGAGAGSFNHNSISGLDASSLGGDSTLGAFGASQHSAGVGSFSYNSNSGLDASSLSGDSRLGAFETSQKGAGAGSFSYNSVSGLDASSLSGDSSLGASGSSQGDESRNSAGGGSISDTILKLGGGTSSFGTRTIENLLNTNGGAYKEAAQSDSSQYQGLSNSGSGRYAGNSNLGLDISNLYNNNGDSSSSGSGSGSYIIKANSGLDASSLQGTRTIQYFLDNKDGSLGSSNAGFGSYITGSSAGLGVSSLVDTKANVGSYNGAANSGPYSYQSINNAESGDYNAASNSELDASSLAGIRTIQQLVDENKGGSYNGVANSASYQYQRANNAGSGSYSGEKDASSLAGTKTTLHLLNSKNVGSYSGAANSGSYHYQGSSGEFNSGLIAGTKTTQQLLHVNNAAANSGSYSYQSRNAAASNSGLVKTTQQLLNDNNEGSYNEVAYSGSYNHQSSGNGDSGSYQANSNSGLDGFGTAGSRTTQHLTNTGNQGSYHGGSNSYSNSIIEHGVSTGFGTKTGASAHDLRTNYEGGVGLHLEQNQATDFGQLNFGRESLDNLNPNSKQIQQGNINIIGGGYSAVKQSTVQVNHNGEDNIGSVQSTVAPVTYSSVPTVTAVPIPTLSTPTVFEQYNGGVVANIPQLQYQVGRAGFPNISSYFNGATSYSYQSQSSHGGSGGLEVQGVSSTLRPEVDGSLGGYIYNKPGVAFDGTASSKDSGFQGHSYESPSVALEETPLRVTPSSTARPTQYVHSNFDLETNRNSGFQGYSYERPSVAFEENPLPRVTTSAPVQPQVLVSSTVQPISYTYPKPSIAFVERPSQPVIISRFSIKKPIVQTYRFEERPVTVRPVVINYQQPLRKTVYSFQDIVQPVQPVSTYLPVTERQLPVRPAVVASDVHQKPEVSSYTFKDMVVQTTARPVQQVYSTARPVLDYLPATERPVLVSKPVTGKPAMVSSYSYVTPIPRPVAFVPLSVSTTPAPQILIQRQNSVEFKGYDYPKPTVSFVEEPMFVEQPFVKKTAYVTGTINAVNPVVVENYQAENYEKVRSKLYEQAAEKDSDLYYNTVSSTPAPFQKVYIQSTPRPTYTVSSTPAPFREVYIQSTPKSVEYVPLSFSTTPAPQILIQKQNNVEFKGYDYPKLTVPFLEEPRFVEQPVEEVPFVKKTAYVTGTINAVNPVVVENYQAENYEKVRSKLYEQAAEKGTDLYYNTVSRTAAPFQKVYIQSTPRQTYTVSSTSTPFQKIYIQSTPRPTYSSTLAAVASTKTQSDNFHYYDSRYSNTPQTVTEGYLYPKPTAVFEEEPATLTREYLPVTTSRPIVRYSFGSLDNQNQYVSQESSTALPKRRVTTPEPSVSYESSTVAREYLPVRTRVGVTTPEPTYVVPVSFESSTVAREYIPVRPRVRVTTPEPTYIVPVSLESSTIAREYLPVRSRVRVTTPQPTYIAPVSRKYLPVRTRLRVTTPEPTYVVPTVTIPGRSRIRVTTDGAASGNLEVSPRRPVKVIRVVKPRTKTIIKQNDMHPILSAKLGAQCTCVSNSVSLRKKQRIIVVEDEDDEDDGYVVGTDDQRGIVVENYQYEPQRDVDITPTPDGIVVPSPGYRRVRVRPTTVTYESEVEEEDAPSDRDLAKAVRTGLKLVKQAAEEGAKEGAEEAISNYSPRTGSSREDIECQRAGLFRHPGQCNKFYSCKWDCKKNKFTLHVFNCPVHLTFDNNLGACNWPSQGPACTDDTLLPNE